MTDTSPTPDHLPPGVEPWCKTLRGQQAYRFEVPGGATALGAWRSLRAQHAETQLWPVVLGADTALIDQLTWRVSILAEDAPGISDLSTVTPAPELLVRWMGDPKVDDYLHDVPRHLAKLQADEVGIRARMAARPDEEAVRLVAAERVHLALIPAAGGWEVPALLAWSGAEGMDITGPDHLSILNFWNQSYGADLVALSLESMELLVEHPPTDARGAFELAVQHYAYCPALMDNLAPAMGALAATLLGRHWLFDWS